MNLSYQERRFLRRAAQFSHKRSLHVQSGDRIAERLQSLGYIRLRPTKMAGVMAVDVRKGVPS